MTLAPTCGVGGRAARAALAVVALALAAAPGSAQSSMGDMRRQATRAEIETAAKAAEAASARAPDEKARRKLQADAAALRQRLSNGDFVPGDRILLWVEGDTVRSDTFTVRIDRRLPLPEIGDISLHGVLDSELEPFLRQELGKYIKPLAPATELVVTATPLVRLQVGGAVPQPNFYTVPVDQSITDLFTMAGGTGGLTSAFDKTVVRRGSSVFMSAREFAEAVRQGKTVGDMALRDGDEIYVPDRATATFNWQTPIAVISSLTGLYFIIRYGFGGNRFP